MKRFLSLLLLFSCSTEQYTQSSLIVSEDNSSDTAVHSLQKDEKVKEQVVDSPYVTAYDTLKAVEVVNEGEIKTDTLLVLDDKSDCGGDEPLSIGTLEIELCDSVEIDTLVDAILVHSFYSATDSIDSRQV